MNLRTWSDLQAIVAAPEIAHNLAVRLPPALHATFQRRIVLQEAAAELPPAWARLAAGPSPPREDDDYFAHFWDEFNEITWTGGNDPEKWEHVRTLMNAVNPAWHGLVHGEGAAWTAALADPAIHASARFLQRLQEEVIHLRFGSPPDARLLGLCFTACGTRRFRTDNPFLRKMDEPRMWFAWAAYADYLLALGAADDWKTIARAILAGTSAEGSLGAAGNGGMAFPTLFTGSEAQIVEAAAAPEAGTLPELLREAYRRSGLDLLND